MIERELEFQVGGLRAVLRREDDGLVLTTTDPKLLTRAFSALKALACQMETGEEPSSLPPLAMFVPQAQIDSFTQWQEAQGRAQDVKVNDTPDGPELTPEVRAQLEQQYGVTLQTDGEALSQPETAPKAPEQAPAPVVPPTPAVAAVAEATAAAMSAEDAEKLKELAAQVEAKAAAAKATADEKAEKGGKGGRLAGYRRRSKPKARPTEDWEVGQEYKGHVVVDVTVDSSLRSTHGDVHRLVLDNGDVASITAAGVEAVYEPANPSAVADWMDPTPPTPKLDATAPAPDSTIPKPWTAADKLKDKTEAELAAERTAATEAAIEAAAADAAQAAATEQDSTGGQGTRATLNVPDHILGAMSVSGVLRWLSESHPGLAADEDAVTAWALENPFKLKAFMGQPEARLRRRVTNLLAAHTGAK